MKHIPSALAIGGYFWFEAIFSLDLSALNTFWPTQYGHHFADGISNYFFLQENWRIVKQILLNFIPSDPVNNKSVLA